MEGSVLSFVNHPVSESQTFVEWLGISSEIFQLNTVPHVETSELFASVASKRELELLEQIKVKPTVSSQPNCRKRKRGAAIDEQDDMRELLDFERPYEETNVENHLSKYLRANLGKLEALPMCIGASLGETDSSFGRWSGVTKVSKELIQAPQVLEIDTKGLDERGIRNLVEFPLARLANVSRQNDDAERCARFDNIGPARPEEKMQERCFALDIETEKSLGVCAGAFRVEWPRVKNRVLANIH